jgi:autoinducer 2 (AI-2) kinase
MDGNRCLLVIDVGTGSGRSIVFDHCGRQLSVAQQEWSHPEDQRYENAFDFDCDSNWKLICECVRRSVRKADIDPEDIVSVSATSMRHGIVCFDASGDEIFAVPNIDARAEEETALLIEEGWGPKIYEIQGDWPSIHALARMRWLEKHNPRVFDQVRMLTMLSDWVIYRLSGEFVTESSAASSSGMFDIKNRDWSEILIDYAGLNKSNVPPVMKPGLQVGEVTARAARETGLPEKTAVMAGMADTQGGYVGSGVISAGDTGMIAGSFWLPSIISAEPLLDPEKRVRTNCHGVENLWIVESCTFYTGLALRWFRDAFCQQEIAMAKELGKDPYEIMNAMAENVPAGSHGIQVIMSNVANNSRWIHAAPAFLNFDVLNPQKFNKASFYRSLLENSAYQTLGELENIARVCGEWPKEIVFSGGGSKSPLLAQIIADTLEIPVKVPAEHEASALGVAAASACGTGLYSDLSEACAKFVHLERVHDPNRAMNSKYRQQYEKWRKIYPAMLELAEKGLTRPMWKAPGT